MKTKHLLFAFPLAAMGFASCSNEEMKPHAIMTGETIKTSLAINVPTEGYTTRQSADITQNNNNYRGMQDLVLFSLTAEPKIDFTAIGKGQLLADPGNVSTDNSSHIYSNVQLPIGATNFLLYGRATINNNDKAKNGSLINTTDVDTKDISNIKFKLEPIVSNEYTAPQNIFTEYLNKIAKVEGWSTTEDADLMEAYKQFTFANKDGQRAGAASMIKHNVQDLYDKMVLIKDISEDVTVDGIADAVMAAINASPFVVTAGVVDWANKQLSAVNNFPQEQGLPDGAAILTCTSGTFAYQNAAPTNGMVVLDITNITYPAELYYYDNTPLWATSKTMINGWWKTTATDWDAVDWSATGDGNFAGKGIIDLTTRTVALEHNINYGVACLETTVKCGSNSLVDNAKDVAGAIADQTIAVPNDGFPVTGILVGGQPDVVGWDFTHSGTSMDKTIYDKDITKMAATYSSATGKNYTLLLDNYSKSGNGQNPVNVAIELENNSGQGFYGIEGYIPNGEKFYLIAKLEIPSNQTITFPEKETRRYPYTNNSRIFMQDYKTVANFTINSLQKAYVTIPDMRSVKLQLGVSVDLKWEEGFEFNPVID